MGGLVGFRPYLWINVFVWARAFCGRRYGHGASFGCNGVPRKIHTGKIGPPQGPGHDGDDVRFPVPRPHMGVRCRAVERFYMARRTCFRGLPGGVGPSLRDFQLCGSVHRNHFISNRICECVRSGVADGLARIQASQSI